MIKSAVISDCGRYRYRLIREWGAGPRCVFIMLNPSTADAVEDDPTIRRCIGFTKRLGCRSLLVVNLFAYRATDPKELKTAKDPIGPMNDGHIMEAMRDPDQVIIAAWGAGGSLFGREVKVRNILPRKVHCLGRTKDRPLRMGQLPGGAPRHPLYVKSDAPLVEL